MFGVLAINKPATWTSRDVVNRVQGMVRPDKVGHTGTLDPMATGVLLLAIGRASRLVEFSLGHTKSYDADFELGFRSDTLDTHGNVEQLPSAPEPSRKQLEREAGKWIGVVEQVPPRFSAINVQGRRAYDLARGGESFELQPRPVLIQRIEISEYLYPRLTARIECGSGTYVRSLGSDIARGLGTDAVMSRLVRTRVGPFQLENCLELDSITGAEFIASHLQPPQLLLADMAQVVLDEEQCRRIRNGLPLRLDNQREHRLAAIDENQILVAVLQRTPHDDYRSLRVFQKSSATDQPKSISMPQSPES